MVCLLSLAAGCSALTGERWYKGNTHSHSWWSDGDSPPEVVVKGYVDRGYNFLVLSDHNILSEGEKWKDSAGKRAAGLAKYEKEFPADSMQKRQQGDKMEYRLKTLDELRVMYDRPGKFIMVQGEEISDHLGKLPVHLNGINLKELVPPQGGNTVAETLQRNVDAVWAQRKATGQPMLVHVNHPNFKYALTAEDIAGLRGEQFFEVYNGHNGVDNHGDRTHLSTERIWDVVLSRRLGELNLPVMYGMATDDAHSHVTIGKGSNPGRGWVMVRAKALTPEALVEAMEKGDFYSSTGVTLRRIQFVDGTLSVAIEPKPGVTYRTQFIGTPRNYDKSVSTRTADDGHVIREYSKDIGKVFAEVSGTQASYKLTGNELYVRSMIISSAKHPNPQAEGDMEVAWTQPVTCK
jgi:hypothetical protein